MDDFSELIKQLELMKKFIETTEIEFNKKKGRFWEIIESRKDAEAFCDLWEDEFIASEDGFGSILNDIETKISTLKINI